MRKIAFYQIIGNRSTLAFVKKIIENKYKINITGTSCTEYEIITKVQTDREFWLYRLSISSRCVSLKLSFVPKETKISIRLFLRRGSRCTRSKDCGRRNSCELFAICIDIRRFARVIVARITKHLNSMHRACYARRLTWKISIDLFSRLVPCFVVSYASRM